jgi:hypothetical protein
LDPGARLGGGRGAGGGGGAVKGPLEGFCNWVVEIMLSTIFNGCV